eukprot:3113812-Lingulodinium_polyedra.AAC.1
MSLREPSGDKTCASPSPSTSERAQTHTRPPDVAAPLPQDMGTSGANQNNAGKSNCQPSGRARTNAG